MSLPVRNTRFKRTEEIAMQGLIFDVKEFALNDGGGIRTTVFFKGCPLRCVWCHNPEGLSPSRELYQKQNGCLQCGLCRRPCNHLDCQGLGRCLHICPKDLVSAAGEYWETQNLADKLLKQLDVYLATGGGVTLSGGEPLLQWEFAIDLLERLRGRVHVAIETSGYANASVFRAVTDLCDLVYMDLKLMDRETHKRYTGVYNDQILYNAKYLQASGKVHRFRTPLIPGITDTEANLSAIRAFVGADSWEQLPYNVLAPAKYPSVGRQYLYVAPQRDP